MARKVPPPKPAPAQADWYLQEWMATLKVSQAKLAEMCDWNRSTMNGVYHGKTSYYRDIVNLLARKLNIEPYELLMPPARAMAFRVFQDSARTIAAVEPDKQPQRVENEPPRKIA